MSYLKNELTSGWKLGWRRDPVFNKWIVGFSNWKVESRKLIGTPSSYTRALIYANGKTEKDYTVTFEFTMADEKTDIRPIFCYSMTRLAGYYLVLRAGEKTSAYYMYSDLFEKNVLEGVDFVPQPGMTYTLRAEVTGQQVDLSINGEPLGSFAASDPCGRYTGLTVLSGRGEFGSFVLSDADGTVFADDFSENSLPDQAAVDYGEFAAVDRWIDAVVPGTVQTSLLEAGIIEDPYLPFDGEKMHWTVDQRWYYRTEFTVPKAYEGKRLRLYFKGVDYRAWFFLNGKALGYHEGMFGGPEWDITKLVRTDDVNELAVCILPCPNPPHSNVRPYILHRWHFNMDIIPSGLWQGVELIADDRMYLTDPQVSTREIRPDGTAVLDLAVTVSTMALWPFDVQGCFTLHLPDRAAAAQEGETAPGSDNAPITVTFAPGFIQGSYRAQCTMEVPHAQLWWPNGLGAQTLYDLDISADLYEYQKQPEPTAHDELHLRTGIRTLRFAPLPDGSGQEPGAGNNPLGFDNWCPTVNGVPFFGKGSNWMPIDQLLRLDKEHYRRLLTRAKDSHINILRPWGAGLLETDDFYDLCDELGILVWQETLFANGIYNLSKKSVWRETMRRSVCRLRNHPSLAVYCGGNEFDPDLPENKDIIDELIAICAELDPSREFRKACPYGGDNHSYLVNWMGGRPYTHYTRDYSPAITEFSLASPPSLETLQRLIPPEELEKYPPDLPDNILRYDYLDWGENVRRGESAYSILDAHLSGITAIMFPPLSECGKPKTMEEFVRFLQTAQGLLTQFGIDCWRARWPQCGMTMSWVFNVIFPDSMSWSYVDWFGVPKSSYYYQKRAYEPLHVCGRFDELFNPAGSVLTVQESAINDTAQDLSALTLRTRLYNSRFELLQEEARPLRLEAHDTKACGVFRYTIPENAPDEVMLLVVELLDADGAVLTRSVYCPRVGAPCERMPYLANGPWISDVSRTRTALELKASDTAEGVCLAVTNTGTVPAFEVSLRSPGADSRLRYSDNAFWLDPGETKRITVQSFAAFPDRWEASAWNADTISLQKEESV